MKWLMLIVVLIKLLTIPDPEVALLQHSRCDSAGRVLWTSQHVLQSWETVDAGWHVDSQQACWPQLNFSHSADVNDRKDVYASLSMLRRLCFMSSAWQERRGWEVDNSFKSFPVPCNFYLMKWKSNGNQVFNLVSISTWCLLYTTRHMSETSGQCTAEHFHPRSAVDQWRPHEHRFRQFHTSHA